MHRGINAFIFFLHIEGLLKSVFSHSLRNNSDTRKAKNFNKISMKQKYYVVWEGASEGVFTSWEACQEAVIGVPGAKYKSFSSLREAEDAYAIGYEAWKEEHEESKEKSDASADIPNDAAQNASPQQPSPQMKTPTGRPDYNPTMIPEGVEHNAIAVDAACAGNPGAMEYRGVYLQTGKEIFHFGPVHGTNNIGEFLAIVHGLALLKQKNLPLMPIYSDSVNAQLWVRKRKCKTTLERNEKTEELYQMIERAEKWLRTNTYGNPIIKWETDKWGEIPADFGRK